MKDMTEQEALSKLAALCARAEHCQQELTEKMRRWGMEPLAQQRILDYLAKHDYVDEERYARAFVRDKTRYNQWGPRKTEQALRLKGIPADVRRRALSQVETEEYAAILRPLLQQKRRTTNADNDYELRQKLIRFALQRGFTSDIIRQCIDAEDADFVEEDD